MPNLRACRIPNRAAVLHTRSARLDLAAERPNLRAGLPRRPPHGECCTEARDGQRAASYQEGALNTIELHRVRYENTGNPLFVWMAILLCFSIGQMWKRSKREHPQPSGHEPYPIPGWCLDYIGHTAFRIDALADGRDFRKVTAEIAPSRAWTGKDADHPLTGRDAAALVNAALNLTSSGRNAFNQLWGLQSKEQDDFSDEALRAEGKSATEAMEIVRKEYGEIDEGSMRRRLRDARRARRARPIP